MMAVGVTTTMIIDNARCISFATFKDESAQLNFRLWLHQTVYES